MKAEEFYSILLNKLDHSKDIIIKKYKIKYKHGEYDFLRITSKEIVTEDKVILIRAGIHGDEVSGPLTILSFCNEIIDYIHQAGLKFIIYPLGNPSGFEAGLRYNIDNDNGAGGNNDFLRYELADGKIVDDVGESDEFKKWRWASDKKLKIHLAQETRLMQRLLKKDPLSQIVACLDLHQDYITPGAPPAAYQYPFGDLAVYENIIKRIEEILPIFRNVPIGAGYNVEIDESGKVVSPISEESKVMTDNYGSIIRHDCTLPDLMYRVGAKYCVTIETTGATPINIACRVNLIWIFGIADLVKGGI